MTIVAPVKGPGKGLVTITFSAVEGKHYIIMVKYDMKSIVGSKAPDAPAIPGDPYAIYSFQMTINGNVVTGSLG